MMSKTSLHTYLHDHAAGARHAVQVLGALKDNHADTSVVDFVTGLLQQVQGDLETLEDLATNIGARGFEVKALAGWLADKLSRHAVSPETNRSTPSRPWNFEAWGYLASGRFGGPGICCFRHP
jgi:hypothetical protein